MRLIRTITDKDFGLKPKSVSKFLERTAVRAILFNKNKEVAVMNVSKKGYHKIPGGGVEPGEDLSTALMRELKEEAGATAKVISELGKIIEIRTIEYSLRHESLCFIAEALAIGVPELSEKEKEYGFSVSWMPINQAIALLEADSPKVYSEKFMHFRDLCFLTEAKKKLKL